jgi:4-amino-4-deoxy-L-arabinose transferase-like glycosyltransferase
VKNMNDSKGSGGSWIKDLILLGLLISLLFGLLLGQRFLQVPDEGRYVEIPREMLALHDYITPHINGIKYFEKPVFFYWLEAAILKLCGLHLWSVRIPSAFMALLGCLFTYAAARKLYGRGCGILAALMLSSSLLYFIMARTVTIDMTLSTLLTGSLFCFLMGTRESAYKIARRYFWAMYVFAGLAVLTKGLIGIIFPGMIIFCWTLIHGEWKNLKNWCIPSGFLIVLLINLPWHILVQLRNPEFFNFYIIQQQFLRYFTDYAGREQPFWFFPVVLFLGFLPWIFFFLQSIWFSLSGLSFKDKASRNSLETKASVFLLLSVFLIYAFFQFSHSQLMPYLLPIFPPMSVLLARYFCAMGDIKRGDRGSLPVFAGLVGLAIFCIVLVGFVGLLAFGFFGGAEQLIPGVNLFYLEISALIFLAMTGFAVFSYRAKTVAHVAIVLALGMSCFCISILINRQAFELNSVQPLAMKILSAGDKAEYKAEYKVFDYLDYHQDLPVYLEHRVILVNDSRAGLGELSFGAAHQDMTGFLVTTPDFWQKEWKSDEGSGAKLFMVISTENYKNLTPEQQSRLHILEKTTRNILATP